MTISFEALGLSKEEITDLVVEKIVLSVMGETVCDEDGDEIQRDSQFSHLIDRHVKKAIDDRVASIAEQYIVPTISKTIDEFVIRKTNEYGESKGEPMTFTEYLVSQGNSWLEQEVDYEGKPIERRNYHSSTPQQTRLTHHVHRYLY